MALMNEQAAPLPAYTLPLKLKVRLASSNGKHIEIGALVTDVDGKSVQYLPLTFDGSTPVDEISQILQIHVTQIAQNLVRRGEAQVPERSALTEQDLSSLVGRVFDGSVVQ